MCLLNVIVKFLNNLQQKSVSEDTMVTPASLSTVIPFTPLQ